MEDFFAEISELKSEREYLEMEAKLGFSDLMTQLNNAEDAAQRHLDVISKLLPENHSAKDVLSDLINRVGRAKDMLTGTISERDTSSDYCWLCGEDNQ